MVDAAALTETLAAVEREVELGTGRFDMGDWVVRRKCGTAGCFAGWRLFQDGYTVLEEVRVKGDWGRRLANPDTGESIPTTVPGPYSWADPWPEEGVTVARYAQHRFDITEDQAAFLFKANNTLRDLRAIVAALINGDL